MSQGAIYRDPQLLSIRSPEQIMARDVVVTSAELLALNATPQEIVPAPGANLGLVFEGMVLHKPAGTAYTLVGNDELAVKYTNAAGDQVSEVETTGFLDQTTAQTRYGRPWTAASGDAAVTPVADAALVLHLLTNEITNGDSPLHVRMFFRVVPMTAFAG